MQKTRISVLALATLVLQSVVPSAAIAAGTCQVSALDTVAGLGTQVNIVSCEGNKTFEMTLTGPAGTSAYAQTVVTDGNGNATTLIPSRVTVTSGTYRVLAADKAASFTVMPDRADDTHSSISATPRTVSAGGGDTVTVTVDLRDRYDNPVTGRPLALISNRSTDDVSGRSAETDDDGRFVWTVRPTEAGRATFVPYDIVGSRQMKLKVDVTVGNATVNSSWLRGSLTGSEQGGEEEDFLLAQAAGTTSSSSLVDHFELELPQAVTEIQANELFSMTIRAMRGDTVVRSYIGSLEVDSSDSDAELPNKGQDSKAPELGRVDFRNVDQGVRKVPLSFALRRTGEQIISVYDKLDPAIRGQIALTVIRDGSSAEKIVILDPKDRAHIKSGETVLLQGKAPSLINLKVKGGLRDVDGESDSEGVFRIEVPLAPTDKEATFFVMSENGTYESEAVHVIIDSDPPVITTVNVDPAEGKTETPALVTLQTEPAATVSLKFNGTETPLTETGGGVYFGTIMAPKVEGEYGLTFSATDSVGNVGNMLVKWKVSARTVGTVQNVKAESQAAQVSLSWDALEGTPVTEYKIYIAKNSDPTNYLYSIGTQKPVTSAVIKDLPSGEVYQFSLTAISKDGQESNEKSVPVTGSPLGLVLKATPGPDSVLLEWSTVPNLPLSSYTLEMGTEPGVYPEKRTVNGEASSFMMRDLISGVTYEFKLTPITVTGQTMSDMAGIAHATPGGVGFVIGAEDPAPDDVFQKLHSGAGRDPNLQDVPSVTSSGISSMAAVIALIFSIALGASWLRMRREHKMTQDFLQRMQDKYSA